MTYEDRIKNELTVWKRRMLRSPGILNAMSKGIQDKINSWIPEKVHKGITVTMKQLIRAVLFGSQHTTREKMPYATMVAMDLAAEEKIKNYRNTASAEGAITGAGGLLLGLADFPILLALKIKLLYEIASIYGYDTTDYKERLYILYVFQLAFSSAKHRKKVFLEMENWDDKIVQLPQDINEFDWRSFQQEYRDYIDLAKLAQLIPIIGAPVGAVANYQLVRKLGRTAIYSYHLRWSQKN